MVAAGNMLNYLGVGPKEGHHPHTRRRINSADMQERKSLSKFQHCTNASRLAPVIFLMYVVFCVASTPGLKFDLKRILAPCMIFDPRRAFGSDQLTTYLVRMQFLARTKYQVSWSVWSPSDIWSEPDGNIFSPDTIFSTGLFFRPHQMFWSGPDDQIFILDQISDPDQNLVDIWIRIRYLVRNPGPAILTFQRIPMNFVLETSHPTILFKDNSPLYATFQHRQLTMPRAHYVCTDIIARLRTMCSVWRHDERQRY